MAAKKTPHSPEQLIKQADALYDEGRYAQSLQILQSIITQPPPAPLNTEQLRTLYHLTGIAALQTGNLAEARQHLQQSLHYARQTANPVYIFTAYDNLSAVHAELREAATALQYMQQAITLKEESGHTQNLGVSYLQLTGLLQKMSNFEGSRKALQQAKHYLTLNNRQQYMPYWHFAAADQFMQEHNPKASVKEYQRAIPLLQHIKDYRTLSRAYSNLGDIMFRLNRLKEAESYHQQALQVARQHQFKPDELHSLVSLAEIALKQKNYPLAQQLLQQTEADMPTYGNIMTRKDALELTAQLHTALGHHAQAAETYRQFAQATQEYYNTELSSTVLDLQARYENEKKERELQQARLQRTESELKALRAQMNPHFIFNALSGIRKELLKGNADAADAYMVRFSRLLRLILDSTRTPLVKLNENIEMLELYIQIEQARQNHRFSYTIKKDPALRPDALYIPGMLLQPLAENAIVHGLFAKEGNAGKLQITFAKAGTALKVTVTDNGVGRPAAAPAQRPGHTSHATHIVQETLQLAWNGQPPKNYFTITDRLLPKGKPAGTRVQLLLPLHLKP
jgi:tetratricopeptide (TPR) repeat protein